MTNKQIARSVSANVRLDTVATDEILDLLQRALNERWNFNYAAESESRISTHSTELLRVDPDSHTITVGSEVKYSGLKPGQPIQFRAQNGGLSIEFVTQLTATGHSALANRLFSACKVEIPKQISYSQLRNALRIDCADLGDLKVTLFTENQELAGKLDNLSTTGCKFTLHNTVGDNLTQFSKVKDCHLHLPDENVIEVRLIILQCLADQSRQSTALRCYFLEMDDEGRRAIENLVDKSLLNERVHSINF